jgi:hypothetical protein
MLSIVCDVFDGHEVSWSWDQVTVVGQLEPGVRREEMDPCQWERAFCGAEGRLGQERGKTGTTSPFRGPTGRYG